jgi:hypothetical protein
MALLGVELGLGKICCGNWWAGDTPGSKYIMSVLFLLGATPAALLKVLFGGASSLWWGDMIGRPVIVPGRSA